MAEKIRVLYVDDDSTLLELCKLFLERSGEFTVTTATSAPEAIRILGQERFDTIVSDYQMPEMDGIEFLKHLKAEGNTTPFIIFTGKGREEVVIEALNAGADGYLQKGGESKSQFAELSHKIKKAVEGRQAEDAFKDSEERFRSLFDSALDMIQIIRPDGSFLHVNPAWKKTLGYSDDDVRTLSVFDIFHPDSMAHCSLKFRELLSGTKAVNIEAQFLTKDKKTISVEGNCTPEQKDGTVVSIRGIFHDITERKLAVEALQKNLTLYEGLIETTDTGFVILDQNGKVLDANQEYVRLSGHENLSQIRGRNVGEWTADYEKEKNAEAVSKCLREGKIRNLEIDYVNAKGRITPIEINATVVKVDGAPQILTLCRDITDRKRAEEEITRLASFPQLNPAMIFEIDPAEQVLFVNPAMQSTMSRLGLSSPLTFIPEDVHKLIREWDTRTRANYDRECSVAGRHFLVTIYLSPEYRSIRFYLTDITERKQAENALQESELRYRALVDNALEAILIFDFSGTALFANHATAALVCVDDPHALIGRNVLEFIAPESRDTVLADFASVMEGRDAFLAYYKVVTATGREKWVESIGKKIQFGGVPADIVMLRDITDRKRAEVALKESERRMKDIINFLPDATLVIDKNGTVLAWNRAMEEMTGAPAEQMIGKANYEYALPFYHERRPITLDLILHEDPAVVAKYPVMKKEGNSLISEIFIPHLNKGRGAHLWFTASPLYDAAGNISGAIESIRDITERKRVEEALSNSETRYRELIELLPQTVFEIDHNGRVTSVNPLGLKSFGYSNEDLEKGLSAFQVFAPKDHQRLAENIQRILQGEPSDAIEYIAQRKDGSTFPVITYSVPIIHEHTPVGLRGVLVDISDRKEAEEALRESERKFRIVLENVPDLILVHRNGIILYVNPPANEVMGYTRDELINKQMSDFIVPEYHTLVAQSISMRMDGKTLESYEIEILTKSGRRRTVSVRGSLIEFAGSPALLNVFTDITERKQAEDALRQVNKQLNLLSSITRHDILNQLMALKGYLELSHEVIDNPTTLIEYIKKEEQAANTIEHQITFTKDYQELGAAAPAWQKVNANIEKALTGLPMRAVRVEVDPNAPEIFADPLFVKVFYNLIDNALRYGGAGMKTIRISSQESDASLTILCEDDGVGISHEDKKRLFTRGFGKNTGLGLFLSREILGITGITITETGEPGKGARFEIHVPAGMWRMMGASE